MPPCFFGRSLPYFRSGGRRSSLESAPIYITPRKKTPTWRCGAQSPARCHRPSRRRPGGTNGRMRALSPGACRGSLGLGRIKALAAQLDAHLGPIDANAFRRTSARPCSASRTSRDPSHRPVRRLEVCPHPAAVFVPGSIATDLRPLCAARPALRGCHPLGLAAREHSDSRPAGLTYSGRQRPAPTHLT